MKYDVPMRRWRGRQPGAETPLQDIYLTTRIAAIPASLTQERLALDNGRLRVEVPPPGRGSGGPAFISQIRLRVSGREHFFCAMSAGLPAGAEGARQGSGRRQEFAPFAEQGYAHRPGTWLSGAGPHRRQDAVPCAITPDLTPRPSIACVAADAEELHFVTEPQPDAAMQMRLEHLLRLRDNHLLVQCRMTNTGRRPLHTARYRPRLLALDGGGATGDLRLRLSYDASPDGDGFRLERGPQGSVLRWPAPPCQALFTRLTGTSAPGAWWQMEWPSRGLAVRETINAPLHGLHLYATPRLICPQALVDLTLQPGQVQCWQRTYSFHML